MRIESKRTWVGWRSGRETACCHACVWERGGCGWHIALFGKEDLQSKYVGMCWDEVCMTGVGAADAVPCAAIFCVWIFVRECVYEIV
jgi:hypothetical protein